MQRWASHVTVVGDALEPSDETLIALAISGDGGAFTRLIDRHYDRIYRLAWRWLGDQTEAEDVAQDVCVRIAKALPAFRQEAAFATWAYRVTYNAAIDRLRERQRISPRAPSELMKLIDAPGDTTAETQLLARELWDDVRRLPPQQRDAVLLIYAEDLSHAEAATIMGCTEATVSWHLHAARKALKLKLEDAGVTP